MHIHLLGICGTFMAGLATLARALGHRVTGSDANAYPPMSDLLAAAGIEVLRGYEPAHLDPAPDLVVIGNALSRGNPAVEHVLDRDLPYTSGPAWLAHHVLAGRPVLAVAGTHGKTTTSAMAARVLEQAGHEPGFLIGGLPGDFGISARLGRADGGWFVVEADEYDTAFFDKRSKFVHYRPRVLIVTNLEFDHADIFPDLAAIQRQFHHLVRTVPGTGLVVRSTPDDAIDDALAMGCWTPVEACSAPVHPGGRARWQARLEAADGSRFTVLDGGVPAGEVTWNHYGAHNVANALCAVAATRAAGVAPATACAALGEFAGVRRRLEVRGRARDVTVYDDFAHHPTAIRATLEALRARLGTQRIIAVLDPASNTMRLGVHRDTLGPALQAADRAWVRRHPDARWETGTLAADGRIEVADDTATIVADVVAEARAGDHVVVMSNGAFDGIHGRLLEALATSGGRA